MKCAWQAYLDVLPLWMRNQVDDIGREHLQELRLRIGRPPELILTHMNQFLDRKVSMDDLDFCMNAATQYSPWTSTTVADGYFTAAGGHRIGICGDAVILNDKLTTVKNVTSLCLRVARDISGVGLQAAMLSGSLLILGSPGRGKTTLLRDIIRIKSNHGPGAVGVVDERREIFPMVSGSFCFSPGMRTEVLSGCPKSVGIETMIKTMNPAFVAVDEITAELDCYALIKACYCGVSIIATAHGESMHDFIHRPVYKHLVENKVFHNIIVMQPDKSWKLERMNI